MRWLRTRSGILLQETVCLPQADPGDVRAAENPHSNIESCLRPRRTSNFAEMRQAAVA
jgi:hypothetical protein